MAKQHVPDTSQGSAPGEPNILDKINFVVRFLMDPCDAPVTVYVTTMWPGLIDMLWAYYEPDVQNILVNLFRWRYIIPRTRTTKKGRYGNKRGKNTFARAVGRWVRFDQDEWISKKIEGWTRFKKRYAGGLFTKMLIFEGVIERVNFWFFVIGLVTDFLYSWSTLLHKTIYCQAQGDDVLLADGPDQVQIGIAGWLGLNLSHIRKQRGRVTWNYSTGSWGGDNGICTVSAQIGPDPSTGPETYCSFRITIRNLGHSAQHYEHTVPVPLSGSTEMTVQCDLVKNDRVSVEALINLGAGTIISPVVLMMGENENEKLNS